MTLPICVLIATRNRPHHVRLLLERLSSMPNEFERIVLVDSSDIHFKPYLTKSVAEFREKLGSLDVIHTEHRSLTRQKNLGLPICLKHFAFQVLDDDVLPPPGYISKSFELLELHGADGVSGITQELLRPSSKTHWFESLFGLGGNSRGIVSSAGIGIPVDTETKQPRTAEWLIGCSMWRSSSIRVPYEESLIGSALFEDVIFSIQNRGKGGLWVDPSLVLNHAASIEERPNSRTYWYRFAHNRIFTLRITSKTPKLQLSRGNVGAVLQIVFGKEQSKRESLKGLMEGWVAALKMRA